MRRRGGSIATTRPWSIPDNRALVDLLGQTGWHITTIDTAVPQGASGIIYHLKRIRAHVKAVWTLLMLGRADRRALYIGGAGGNGLWYQVAVAIVGSILGFRIVFHHHSYAYLNQRKLAMRLIARVPFRGGCHILLCAAMARAFHDVYGSMAPVVVISNSSFLELPPRPRSPRRPNLRDGLTLGHLSNLTIEKGLADVIRTLEAFVGAGLPASLRLAGPILTDEARELIAEASRDSATLSNMWALSRQAQLSTFCVTLMCSCSRACTGMRPSPWW